ncbi:MAG: Type II secretion system protein E [Candidatus Omnitrophica bacterium]|nr:Type II secretion system protein E [Candidatus Omnitrophota bacterium]
MASSLKDRLTTLLVQNNLIDQAQLDEALAVQKQTKESIGNILVSLGHISRDDLLELLSAELSIPAIHLSRYKVQTDALAVVPRKMAERYCLMPISRFAKTLTLAISDPMNVHAVDDIKLMTGLEIRLVLASEKEIREAIETHYTVTTAGVQTVKEDKKEAARKYVTQDWSETDDKIQDVEPVVKLTNSILTEAVLRRSSDIFVEPEEKQMRVRYRVDGLLQEGVVAPRAMHPGVVSRIKVMSNLDIAEHRIPQDGRFRIKLQENEVDLRVSVLPTYFGEKVVMRVMDKGQAELKLDKLGFEANPLDTLKKAADHPHGMIVVCGPTGSGKTRTLYSVLKHVDKPSINIVTVEDPVEIQMEGINQVAVRPEVDLTFASALRSILRQDPDVILVGEIRDNETANIAIKAAMTGHLVLSTLHATTAPGAITRFLNMGIEPFLITSSLLMAGSQRLVRRICDKCKESYEPSAELLKELSIDPGKLAKKPVFFRGKGCKACAGTGYWGRAVLLEAMTITTEIKEMILQGAPEYEVKKAGRKLGMMTLRENGAAKVLAGTTTPEEVMRVTVKDEVI